MLCLKLKDLNIMVNLCLCLFNRWVWSILVNLCIDILEVLIIKLVCECKGFSRLFFLLIVFFNDRFLVDSGCR